MVDALIPITPHSLRLEQLDTLVPLTYTSLGCGRKSECPEKTHTDLGRTRKLYPDSGPGWESVFFLINIITNQGHSMTQS